MDSAFRIFLLIFGILAALSSFSISIHILKFTSWGKMTVITRLIFLIHVTLMIECLASLPQVNNDLSNNGFCKFVSIIEVWSKMAFSMNILVLAIAYRYIFVRDSIQLLEFIKKWGEVTIFLISLIALTALIDDHIDIYRGYCAMGRESKIYSILYYGIFSFTTFATIVVCLSTVYSLYKNLSSLIPKILSTLGCYTIVTTIINTVRTLTHFFSYKYLTATRLYLYTGSFLLAIVYLVEMNSLKQFNDISVLSGMDTANLSFSWDAEFRSSELSIRNSTFNEASKIAVNPLALDISMPPDRRSSVSVDGVL